RERLRNLGRDLNCLADGNRTMVQPLTQGLAFQKFGDEEGDFAMSSDVVDGDDVGMVQRGDAARLLLEAAQTVAIGAGEPDQLKGDSTVQATIVGTIHLSHAAL